MQMSKIFLLYSLTSAAPILGGLFNTFLGGGEGGGNGGGGLGGLLSMFTNVLSSFLGSGQA
jgi:hypothetical protein